MPPVELLPCTLEARNFVQPRDRLPLPRIEQMSHFVEIADKIGKITGKWNPVELVTPDNVKEEKERFFDAYRQGEVYNPVFRYTFADQFELGTSRQKLTDLARDITRIRPQNRTADLTRSLLYMKVRDDLATVQLVEGLQSRDDRVIAQAVKAKYPGTDEILLEAARKEFEDRVNGRTDQQEGERVLTKEEEDYLRNKKFGAGEIRDAITWMLDRYGLLKSDDNPEGFAVVVDEHATSIDARDKSENGPTVFIPQDREMDGIELLTVGQHELEHVRQSVNGQKLFVVGGGKMKIDDETFYEGGGLRGEDRVTKKLLGKVESKPNAMFYVFAIHSAEQGRSFYEIFTEQLPLHLQVALKQPDITQLPSEIEESIIEKAMKDSWLVTYRAMRGHIDTTNTAGFANQKDLAYMRGKILDNDLSDKGLSFMNEAAIVASGGLQQLGEFNLSEAVLPVPYQEVAVQYWKEVLKPHMQA